MSKCKSRCHHAAVDSTTQNIHQLFRRIRGGMNAEHTRGRKRCFHVSQGKGIPIPNHNGLVIDPSLGLRRSSSFLENDQIVRRLTLLPHKYTCTLGEAPVSVGNAVVPADRVEVHRTPTVVLDAQAEAAVRGVPKEILYLGKFHHSHKNESIF